MPDTFSGITKKKLQKYWLWMVMITILALIGLFVALRLFVEPGPIAFKTAKPMSVIVGSTDCQLAGPNSVAVGLRGELFIVDSGNHRVVVFDEDGRYSFAFGGPGSGRAELADPVSISISPNGKVYIADQGKQALQVFNSEGEYLYTLDQVASKKIRPTSVKTDQANNVYIYDALSSSLIVLNSEGKPAAVQPEKIGEGAIAMEYDPDRQRIFALDSDERTVFELKDEKVRKFTGARLINPTGLAYLRSRKTVLISDANANKVVVYSDSGAYLGEFGGSGDGMADFKNPAGMAVDERGKLYVADKGNNRIVIYTLD